MNFFDIIVEIGNNKQATTSRQIVVIGRLAGVNNIFGENPYGRATEFPSLTQPSQAKVSGAMVEEIW